MMGMNGNDAKQEERDMTAQKNFVDSAIALHALRISELNLQLVEELRAKFEEVLGGSTTFVA